MKTMDEKSILQAITLKNVQNALTTRDELMEQGWKWPLNKQHQDKLYGDGIFNNALQLLKLYYNLHW